MNRELETGDVVLVTLTSESFTALVVNVDTEGDKASPEEPIYDLDPLDGSARRWARRDRLNFIRRATEDELADNRNRKRTPTWSLIRDARIQRGLSRKDVQDLTGLGASVIWRAEQEGKDVGDENVTKILDALTNAQPKVRTSKSRKVDTVTGEAAQLIAEANRARDEWMAKVSELRAVIDTAYALAEAKRTEAHDHKRSTLGWDNVLATLEPHITEK